MITYYILMGKDICENWGNLRKITEKLHAVKSHDSHSNQMCARAKESKGKVFPLKSIRSTFFILIKTSMVVIRLLYILDSFVWFLDRFDLLKMCCVACWGLTLDVYTLKLIISEANILAFNYKLIFNRKECYN